MGFCDQSLSNYYRTNFILMYQHKFSLNELENSMIPWERDIYISLLAVQLQKEKEQQEKANRR